MSRGGVISLSGVAREPDATESDLVAPQRPLFQRAAYPPRLSLNGLLILLLCTVLLVISGFMPVTLPSPLHWLDSPPVRATAPTIRYTLQLPLALFIGAFLGPFMGPAAVLLFLGIGLALYPVFANGGGWTYVFQPGFGYLLGALLMASLLGKTFHKPFLKKENTVSRSLKLLLKSVVAVGVLHAAGLLYMAGLCVAGALPWAELPGLALRLSVESAPYDLLAATLLICLVRQMRLALWWVLY